MSIKGKVKVPEGMLKAALDVYGDNGLMAPATKKRLEAALEWLAENPIVPTLTQIRELFEKHQYGVSVEAWQHYFAEWQRRMFLQPLEDDEVEDMQLIHLGNVKSQEEFDRLVRAAQRDAYQRGLKKGQEGR